MFGAELFDSCDACRLKNPVAEETDGPRFSWTPFMRGKFQ